jgi:hypothetical protein
MVLEKDVSIQPFEKLMGFVLPTFFEYKRSNELKLQGLRLIVPFLRAYKN